MTRILRSFLVAPAVFEVCVVNKIIDRAKVFKILSVSRAPMLI